MKLAGSPSRTGYGAAGGLRAALASTLAAGALLAGCSYDANKGCADLAKGGDPNAGPCYHGHLADPVDQVRKADEQRQQKQLEDAAKQVCAEMRDAGDEGACR